MGLADARAMYPSLPVVEADFEADRRLLEAIADWCDRYTPLIGLDPPDGLLLDVTGCAHLFGGEAALARDLVRRLEQQGLPRVPRWPTRSAAPGAWRAMAGQGIVPRGETRSRGIAAADRGAARRCRNRRRPENRRPQPASPISPRGRARRSPRASAQMFVRRLDQALGREDEPITPRLPVPAAMAEQRFPEPIAREADVLGTIEHLARQLAVRAGAARRGRAADAGGAVSRRRQGASARDRHRLAAARSRARAKAVRGAARRARRRLRSGLRLRHGAALGARHRAHRSGADRPRRRRTTPRNWRI